VISQELKTEVVAAVSVAGRYCAGLCENGDWSSISGRVRNMSNWTPNFLPSYLAWRAKLQATALYNLGIYKLQVPMKSEIGPPERRGGT
jgi:hypothetical protein